MNFDLTQWALWLVELVAAAFAAVWNLIQEAVLWALEGLLGVVASGFEGLPSPSFLSQSNLLGDLLSGLPPFTLWVIGHLHIPEAFALVAGGVVFNLTRKLLTLGQW